MFLDYANIMLVNKFDLNKVGLFDLQKFVRSVMQVFIV